MNRVVIGVGSNIDPEVHIGAAKERIVGRHRLVASSGLVETEPIGYAEQANYLNGAWLIETAMSRRELKRWLREVEADLGRTHEGDPYGPRTIDLDIVVWNGVVVDPDVYERDFLREAVLAVCPELEGVL